MSHRTFDDPHSIEARQALLDNRCERLHPKRHRTRRKRAAKARADAAARRLKEGQEIAARRRFNAAVRAYWAGEAPENPAARR